MRTYSSATFGATAGMWSVQEESVAPYMMADASGPPMMDSGGREGEVQAQASQAQPEAANLASRTVFPFPPQPYLPAFHLAGHLTGAPAAATTTSTTCTGWRSSDPGLALHQHHDNASYNSTAFADSPRSRVSAAPISPFGFYFPTQPIPDVYTPAASSPHSHFKYFINDYTLNPSHSMPSEAPETMQTPPVSAHPSPNDAAMNEPRSRKRSHSVMSADDEFRQQMIAAATANSAGRSNGTRPASRSGSVNSGGGEVEEYSSRGSRAFKRGTPPKDENGKYICNFTTECRGLTFDRKCEWSKHMDKHDRPYRCPHEACGKLQGFTYSGGLLRHEREVHGKHGGPRAQLVCPHTDCKRHAGKGFTRKENLNEHLRRVHFGKGQDSQDVGPGDEDEDDSATQEAFAALAPSHPQKRKRSLNDTDAASENTFLRNEIAMLRAENDRKDAIIQDLTRQLSQTQGQSQPHEQTAEAISSYQST